MDSLTTMLATFVGGASGSLVIIIATAWSEQRRSYREDLMAEERQRQALIAAGRLSIHVLVLQQRELSILLGNINPCRSVVNRWAQLPLVRYYALAPLLTHESLGSIAGRPEATAEDSQILHDVLYAQAVFRFTRVNARRRSRDYQKFYELLWGQTGTEEISLDANGRLAPSYPPDLRARALTLRVSTDSLFDHADRAWVQLTEARNRLHARMKVLTGAQFPNVEGLPTDPAEVRSGKRPSGVATGS